MGVLMIFAQKKSIKQIFVMKLGLFKEAEILMWSR